MDTITKLTDLAKAVRIESKEGMAVLGWDKRDKWQQDANDWRITLHYQGRRYSFDFWQGVLIKDAPTVEGVLECILSEASCGLDTFEDYCDNIGADVDSRKAFANWKACARMAKRLQTLFGSDYQQFMDVER